MNVNLVTNAVGWFNPLQWTGPVLEKELRVLSRRKRMYGIKGAFPLVLAGQICIQWLISRAIGHGAAVQSQQMSAIAQGIVSKMTLLQFILCHCMAIVTLSHAMADEARRRTMDVLMTTPIRSYQVILGTFMGRLAMIGVVLAVGFPVLAVIRVWGGIPWGYLVAAWSVTVCGTLCVAALSLWLSMYIKKPHRVSLLVFFIFGAVSLAGWASNRLNLPIQNWLLVLNPPYVFGYVSRQYAWSSGSGVSLWVKYCGIMLGGCVTFVVLSVAGVRWRCVNYVPGRSKRRLWTLLRKPSTHIRPVQGPPVVWRMLKCSPGKYLLWRLPWIVLCTGILIGAKLEPGQIGRNVYRVMNSVLSGLSLLNVIVIAASSLTRDKESRALSILLGTPMSDEQIIRQTLAAVCLKTVVFWGPLLLNTIISCLFMDINALNTLLGILSSAGLLWMGMSTGLFYSVRMKTGMAAISATVVAMILAHILFVIISVTSSMIIAGLGIIGPYLYIIVSFIIYYAIGFSMFKMAHTSLRRYGVQ